jgi:putative acetyltransferase
VSSARFIVRQAEPRDADELAAVHVDSIWTLGAKAYGAEIIRAWGGPRTGERYRAAMGRECFFVAVEDGLEQPRLLGFSSYRLEDGKHRTAVYVAGRAGRMGVGSALFRAAEAAARQSGAGEIHVDASLAAVDFYRANGFEEQARGQHPLGSGVMMDCVFMRKKLS